MKIDDIIKRLNGLDLISASTKKYFVEFNEILDDINLYLQRYKRYHKNKGIPQGHGLLDKNKLFIVLDSITKHKKVVSMYNKVVVTAEDLHPYLTKLNDLLKQIKLLVGDNSPTFNNPPELFIPPELKNVKYNRQYSCKKDYKNRFFRGYSYMVLGVDRQTGKVLVRDHQKKRFRLTGNTFVELFLSGVSDKKSKQPDAQSDKLFSDIVLGDYYYCKEMLKDKLEKGEYYQIIEITDKNISIRYYREETLKNKGSDEIFVNKIPVKLRFISDTFHKHFDENKSKPPKEPFKEKVLDENKPTLDINNYYKCIKDHTKKRLKKGNYYLVRKIYKGSKSGSWHIVFYDGDRKLDFYFERFMEYFDITKTKKPKTSDSLMIGMPTESEIIEEPEEPEKGDIPPVGFVTQKIKKGGK